MVYTDYAALPEAVHYGYRVTGELEVAAGGKLVHATCASNPLLMRWSAPTACKRMTSIAESRRAYRTDMVWMNYWQPFIKTLAESLEVKA